MVVQVAGDPHAAPQTMLIDQSLKITAQRAIAHDDQLEVDVSSVQTGRGLDQDNMALLLGQTTDVQQPGRSGIGSSAEDKKISSSPQWITWILRQSAESAHR